MSSLRPRAMILLDRVGPGPLALFGEHGPEPAPLPVLPALGGLYDVLQERALRGLLQVSVPVPVPKGAVEAVRDDIDRRQHRLDRIQAPEDKLMALRDLWMARDIFEVLGLQEEQQHLQNGYLNSVRRGQIGGLFCGLSAESVETALGDRARLSALQAWSLVETLRRWRRYDPRTVEILVGRSGDFADLADSLAAEAVEGLRQRVDTAALILLEGLLSAGGQAPEGVLQTTRTALVQRFERHLDRLEDARDWSRLRTLFIPKDLAGRVRGRLVPDYAGRPVDEAIALVQPFAEVLDDDLRALIAYRELEAKVLSVAQACLDCNDLDGSREALDPLLVEAGRLGVGLAARAVALCDQTTRAAALRDELWRFSQTVDAAIGDGRFRDAMGLVVRFSPTIDAPVDLGPHRADAHRRVVQAARLRADADLRSLEQTVADAVRTDCPAAARATLDAYLGGRAFNELAVVLAGSEGGRDPTVLSRLRGLGETLSARIEQSEERVLDKAAQLQDDRRWIELFLFCERHAGVPGIDEMAQGLRRRLEQGHGLRTSFRGERVVWFGKHRIVMQRNGGEAAEVSHGNRAISGVPMIFSFEHGRLSLKVERSGRDRVTAMDIDRQGGRRSLPLDTDHDLPAEGRLVLSDFFGLAWSTLDSRFVRLSFEPPDPEAFRRTFGRGLDEIWPEWQSEADRIVLFGA